MELLPKPQRNAAPAAKFMVNKGGSSKVSQTNSFLLLHSLLEQFNHKKSQEKIAIILMLTFVNCKFTWYTVYEGGAAAGAAAAGAAAAAAAAST
jgi:hypothetical protein